MEVVIIGGVACGPKTAATLARRLPQARITVYQKDNYLSLATCGLPYFASGDIPGIEVLKATSYGVERNADFFRNSKGFEIVTGAEVTAVDRKNKTVTVQMTGDEKSFEKKYDKLVLATGAIPNKPAFALPPSERVGFFTRPDDALQFRNLAERGQISKAVIIGGGFIGCELAEATGSLWGIETILLEKEEQLLPYLLDPDMATIVERELRRQEIEVLTGTTVEKIELNDSRVPVVHISDNDPIETDYVFLCLGVRPNTQLARECGLVIGDTGGIAVDSHLTTSDPNIFAGGDCVETINRVSGKEFYLPMGSLANRHGRVVAENIAGNPVEYQGALGTCLVKIYDLNVGSVGLSGQMAGRAGIKAEAVWGSFTDRPEYYPEAQNIVVKLVFNPDDQKVLGLQAIGKGDVCRRIDVCSALMQKNSSLSDFLNLEHGYAPPYAEALDPLHHLAALALASIRGLSVIGPAVDFDSVARNTLWLDVREPAEVEAEPWPLSRELKSNLVCIPLNELVNRLDEIESGREIMIVCKRGARSYQAANILKKFGYENVHIIGGGFQASQL